MSAAVHDPECEKAEPGSLCDCDCAGARHAVRRTAGNVAAAGAVSRRARRIAEKDGRAPVVNRLAGEPDRHRADNDGRKPGRPATVRGKDGTRTRSASRTPALSPHTQQLAEQARRTLPADRDGWKAAGRETDPVRVAGLKASVEVARGEIDRAQKDIDNQFRDFVVKEMVPALLKETKGKAGYRQYKNKNDPALLADAELIAPARMWDPEYASYRKEADDLAAKMYDATRALERRKNVLHVYEAQGEAPIDVTHGYQMPTAELNAHLDRVMQVGKAAHADAQRAWQSDPAWQKADADVAHIAAVTRTRQEMHEREKRFLENGSNVSIRMPDGQVRRFFATRDRAEFEKLFQEYTATIYGGKARQEAHARRAAVESQTLHRMLSQHRGFGGITHANAVAGTDHETLAADQVKQRFGVTAPRADWRARLTAAEQFYPDAWLAHSAAEPLQVGASRRAYHSYHDRNDGTKKRHLSMTSEFQEKVEGRGDGGIDRVDEVTIHELGHRMEQTVPGLTQLEFAYVRRRATTDGGVEAIETIQGYDADEVSQKDDWGHAYAGKTYEQSDRARNPGELAWEVFQVGTQDLWARTSTTYGPNTDPTELQHFAIGALLTLG